MSNLAHKVQSLVEFSNEKKEVIRQSVGKGLTDAEFVFYLEAAKARGLDPVMNQIHPVKRKDKSGRATLTLQVGIDGFRLIAHRSNCYAGQEETIFTYKNDSDKNPTKAKVTVYKIVQGMRVPFTATANWSEYCPSGNMAFMWNKMPETMLEKCAEAKALRKAFPSELAGIYTSEEMHQADGQGFEANQEIKDVNQIFSDEPKEEKKAIAAPSKNEVISKLLGAFEDLNISMKDLENYVEKPLQDVTPEELNELRSIYTQCKLDENAKFELFGGENEQ